MKTFNDLVDIYQKFEPKSTGAVTPKDNSQDAKKAISTAQNSVSKDTDENPEKTPAQRGGYIPLIY